MKIQLLTHEWPPHIHGGAGVHVVQLAQALTQATAEVDVVPFLHLDDEDEAFRARLGNAKTSVSHASASCAYAALAVARAAAGSPDVVHSHTWFANLAGHTAGLTSGVPHVMTAHSVERARPWKRETRGREYDYSLWVEESALRGSAAIIAVSQAVARELAEHHPTIPEDRVRVIYNGVDTSSWYPDQDRRGFEQLGLNRDRPYIVYLGRVSRQKGLAHLLTAYERLSVDVDLVVFAGESEPSILAEVEASIDRLRAAGKHVVLISRMYDIECVRPVVAQAEVMVVPSSYEPLGMVALEAFACGTPVVAAAVGGLPEIVTADTGWLCPVDLDPATRLPADPPAYASDLAATLEAALADQVELRRRGATAVHIAQDRYAWGPIAEQTLAVYRSVTGIS